MLQTEVCRMCSLPKQHDVYFDLVLEQEVCGNGERKGEKLWESEVKRAGRNFEMFARRYRVTPFKFRFPYTLPLVPPLLLRKVGHLEY